jgi:hypothetical protein
MPQRHRTVCPESEVAVDLPCREYRAEEGHAAPQVEIGTGGQREVKHCDIDDKADAAGNAEAEELR